MAFDLDGARKAGYSDDEIAGYLATQRKFDLPGALKAGYTAPEVVSYLAAKARPTSSPSPSIDQQADGDMGRVTPMGDVAQPAVAVNSGAEQPGASAAAPAVEVGPAEALGRGIAAAPHLANVAARMPVAGFGMALDWLNSVFGTPTDYAKQQFEKMQASDVAAANLGPQPGEEFGTVGKGVFKAVSGLGPLAVQLAQGGPAGAGVAAERAALPIGAKAAADMASPVEKVIENARAPILTATPIGTSSAEEKYQQLVQGGVEPSKAALLAGFVGLASQAQMAAPLSVGSQASTLLARIASRAAQGGATSVITSEGLASAQNELADILRIDPRFKQQPDAADHVADALVGMVLGQAGHHTAESRAAIPEPTLEENAQPVAANAPTQAEAAVGTAPGREDAPVPGVAPAPGFPQEARVARPVTEAPRDHLADIAQAPTIDAAIDAAQRVVDESVAPTFAQNAGPRGALLSNLERDAAQPLLEAEAPPPVADQPIALSAEETPQPAMAAALEKARGEESPTAAAEAPRFEDFTRRSDGQVKTFPTQEMAELYQAQRSNRVPGDMVPRLADDGWRLSREAATAEPEQATEAHAPAAEMEEQPAAEAEVAPAPSPANEIAHVADAVARGEAVAPELLAKYPALAELVKAKDTLDAAARRQAPLELAAERRPEGADIAGGARPLAAVRQDLAEISQKSRVPINVVQSVTDLPFHAAADAKGAFHQGRVWIVADNAGDTVDVQKTAARHELLHAGFDALYGNDTKARERALKELVVKNRNLREWSSVWRVKYGNDFVKEARAQGLRPEDAQREMVLRSWEEGAAYFAQHTAPLNGWQRFAAVIQEGLRKMGLHALADSLEGVTNAEAQRTIADILGATQATREGIVSPPASIQPAFSRASVVRPGEGEKAPVGGKILETARTMAKALVEDIQKAVTPMGTGSDRARAIAKDYANAERLARDQWNRFDVSLTKNFSRKELRTMWEAADEENVLRQKGEPTVGKGLDRLTPLQRKTVENMHGYANSLLAQAKDVGMFKGEGLPFWTPRMIANIGKDGEFLSEPHSGGGASSTPYSSPTGRNITTSAASLRHREHLTTAQTESAAKAKFGDNAQVVKDIRTMPLAMARLERAIAGRQLINEIKSIGQKTGQDLVSTSEGPGYFTIDHPAFKTYRPRFEEADGKQVAMKDGVGNVVMDKTPLYVSKEFEGPLKAIMTDKPGAVYSALMAFKSKTMGVIMYSPLIHNAVEWGRAMPLMPGKVLTFRVYFEGNRARADAETMREFVSEGLVPIGKRFGNQDISGVVEDPNIVPGRSLTAKALGGAVGLVNGRVGEAVKRGVDKAGDFWHNTLLWDRVADLQAGIAVNMRDSLMADGMDRQTAVRLAAHLANRFAGALPNEAMSAMSRKIANLVLFSRTFTIGNMGVLKDMVTGLPKDVKAQILRDAGPVALTAATSKARQVAIHAFVADLALMYGANAALQSAFDYWKNDDSLDEITRGYVDRFNAMLSKVKENPSQLLNVFDNLQSLSPTSGNEPGKEDRIRFGTADDGTAIYIRLPTGKIGEEFQGWLTSPLEMLKRKESTIARPTVQMLTNDKGFGRPVYDETAKGISGVAGRIGSIVWNYLSQQVPADSIAAVSDLARGKGDETSALKVIGPLLGVTFSKGAPGGPAVGELFAAEKEHRAEVARALPSVKDLLKNDDVPGAVEAMQTAHMTREEMEVTLRYAGNPAARLSERRLKEFYEIATPERQERMQRALQSP